MTVLALHGFWGSPEDWDLVRERLVDLRYRWIVPDLHKADAAEWSGMQDWVKSLSAQVEGVDPHELLIVGYSMGGRWALRALVEGLRARSLVALSANPFSLTPAQKMERRKSDAQWAERFLREPDERLISDWQDQTVLASSARRTFRPLTGLRRSLAWALTQGSLAEQPDLRPAIGHLERNPLWLVGALDAKYVDLQQRMVREGWPGRYLVLEAVGHRLILDAPGRVADELRAYWTNS